MKQTHKELRLLAFLRHVERVFEANEGEEGQHRPLHDCKPQPVGGQAVRGGWDLEVVDRAPVGEADPR